MGNGSVRTIVMLMLVVVLSMVVGAQISDSMAASSGAFVIIGLVCMAFAMLLVGEKSWMLLYIVPAFLYNAPIGSAANSGLYQYPVALYSACMIFGYGILMWGMGYIHFHWRSLLLFELCVICISLLMVASFIRYPVSIRDLDPDAEFVGGKEYIWWVGAVVYYIALSSMSSHYRDMRKVMKWSFYALCIGQGLYTCKAALSGGAIGGERYGFLGVLASAGCYYVYSSDSVGRLLLQPKKILMGCASFVGVLMVGGREIFIASCSALVVSAWLKKELTVLTMLMVCIYGGILVLDSNHALKYAPPAFQRVLTLFPGVHVSEQIEWSTAGSTDTRRMVWAMGLDPRTGYIKDYVWGDGFRMSTQYLNRANVAAIRGVVDRRLDAGARALAASGSWHNGALSTVHRLGVVGLLCVCVYFICGMVVLIKISHAYRRCPEYPHIMALILPFAQISISYLWGTQNLMQIFNSFYAFGIMKVLYCTAREEGLIRPLFLREQYVPMTIRELEKTA